MPPENFLKQVDEAGPRTLRGELVVEDTLDPELVRLRVGEAVADMAIGMDLPIRAGRSKFLSQSDDRIRRNHRIVPAVEGDDFRRDLLRRKARRVEQTVETNGRDDVRATSRKIQRAHPTETIAGNDDVVGFDLAQPPRLCEDRLQPPKQRGAVGL